MRAALKRHLPGARGRMIESAFRHGWHSGWHAAREDECPGIDECESHAYDGDSHAAAVS